MNKIVLTSFIFLVVIGCSNKQKELKPKKVENNETKIEPTKIENNETKIKSIEIKNNEIKIEPIVEIDTTKKNMMVIQEEFIPEHIRNSHIEVVEHY